MARHARQQRPHRGLVLFVPWLGLCFCWAPAFVGSHTKIARRLLLSSQAAADPAVLEAAKQVRDVQDSGPSGNVQWNLYVNTFADAKDGSVNLVPGSYDAGFLEDFVANFKDGYRLSSASAAVAEGAQFEESGQFTEALDAYLIKQDVTGITAMSEEVAGEFLKICGQLCLRVATPGAPAQSQNLQKLPSSASEVAREVYNVQNSGPSGAKQWAEYLKTFAEEGSSRSFSPAKFEDDFLRDFLDNFNDGYRLSSASAAAAECAELESSGTFAKAMEDFLRRNGNDADIPAVTDKVASEFFQRCAQLVILDSADEVITPETPEVSTPKTSPLPPIPPLPPQTDSLSVERPPLPPLPQNSGSLSAETPPPPKNGKKGGDAPTRKVKAQAPDVIKPPLNKEPAQSQRPALAPKTALEPRAMDAKARLNEWMHSRLERKPTLGEDMTFGFALQEAGGRPNYAAELSFLNKKLVPSGTATFSGTPQKTKRDAMDSAAHAALLALDVET